jgi:hypothetical protein
LRCSATRCLDMLSSPRPRRRGPSRAQITALRWSARAIVIQDSTGDEPCGGCERSTPRLVRRSNRPDTDSDRLAARGSALRRQAAGLRKLPDQFDRLVQGLSNIAGALRAVLLDIGDDGGEIVASSRSVAYSHRSKRFQSASISASGTNSPRRAGSSPWRIAARASSSSETRPAPSLVIASKRRRAYLDLPAGALGHAQSPFREASSCPLVRPRAIRDQLMS